VNPSFFRHPQGGEKCWEVKGVLPRSCHGFEFAMASKKGQGKKKKKTKGLSALKQPEGKGPGGGRAVLITSSIPAGAQKKELGPFPATKKRWKKESEGTIHILGISSRGRGPTERERKTEGAPGDDPKNPRMPMCAGGLVTKKKQCWGTKKG